MVRKTLLLAGLLFVMYSVFVAFLAPTWWSASQHQWQDNVVKAQKFIYNERDSYENVIVGSSLSARLVMDSIPNTYNLSFGGQSIFDGLNILTHSTQLPKTVFIEMNFVDRAEDKTFTSSLYSVLFYPKKALVSLRDDKQPIGIIGSKMSYRLIGKLIAPIKSFLGLTSETNSSADFFSKMLQMQKNGYSQLPNDSLINESFNNLSRYVSDLEKKKVEVVFFEMPVNSELVDLPAARVKREVFYKRFPGSRYKYIPMPESEKYVTTDGVHLNEQEALKYTMYLKTKM